MIVFPALKTGAVAQYPGQRLLTKTTWIGRFVDGSEQRFRNDAGPLHKWTVSLSLLTESEIVSIREFVDNVSGRFEAFSFTDPWDGVQYSNCSLDTDTSAIEWFGENNARTTLVIRENRS